MPTRHCVPVKSARILSGKVGDLSTPDWTALEDLIRDEVLGYFMWMAKIELEDGSRVDLYKHRVTRGYLHLDSNGRAFHYTEDGRYQEVDPAAALAAVIDGAWGPWGRGREYGEAAPGGS
jgi:hypothetical protein